MTAQPLPDEQLAAIRNRIPAHYPAPWTFEPDDDGTWTVLYPSDSPNGGLIATVPDYGYDLAEFLAAARADVPALLAEVDRLRAQDAAHVESLAAVARLASALQDYLPGDGWHLAHVIEQCARGEITPAEALKDDQ